MVDLSTLATDDSNRTRQVRNNILETNSDDFRFATFETTALTGLPDSINFGEPFDFQLTGNLTIHGVTLEKTFAVTATAVSESRIEGLARLAITYPEFEVRILRLPQQVASVEENLILELEFVAEAG
jgi:polyisoprenoid-binding protein YceI